MPPHAIVLADIDGMVRHWSDGAEDLFGYSADEARGQPVDLIVPDEHREAHWHGFRRAMSTGVSKLHDQVLDVPVQVKGGDVLPFRARFTFLRDAVEQPLGAMVIFVADERASG